MPGGLPIDWEDLPTLLDARYRDIKEEEIADQEDIIAMCYTVRSSDRRDERYGDVGEMANWPEFTGALEYGSVDDDYTVQAIHREYAFGFRVVRRMVADDLSGLLRGDRFRQLARAGVVTRQIHATRLYEMAGTNDTYFYNRSEGLPLASAAHTTRAAGVSTAAGFNNLIVGALNQVNVRTAMILGRKIASNQGQRSNMIMNELHVPIDQAPRSVEILQSAKQPDTMNNNINPERGKLTTFVIPLWSSTSNWAIMNDKARKENCYWLEREEPEYGKISDFDTFQLKWRGYQRHSTAIRNWRFAVWAVNS